MNTIINKIAIWGLRESFKFLIMTTTIVLAACNTTLSPDTGVADQSKMSSTPPPVEIVSLYISSKKGIEDFRSGYWAAKLNKAFASSDDGHWGWSTNMAMKEYATETAMRRCEEHLRPGDRKCKVVNINGVWIPHTVIPAVPVTP